MKMKFNLYLVMLTMTALVSCGKDSSTGGDGEGDTSGQTISAEQLGNLSNACMTESDLIQLPTPLTLPANYTSNEYAGQIWAASTTCQSLVLLFGTLATPNAFATIAAADGFNVFDGEEAYTWGVGPNRLTYIVKDDGYQILEFDSDSDLLGAEKIRVRQNEDCSNFEISMKATSADEDLEPGSELFRMVYRNENVQQYDFSNFGGGDTHSYSMRSFDDLSGDLRITDTSDNSQLVMIWQIDGSGSWEVIENNISVDSGTWTF